MLIKLELWANVARWRFSSIFSKATNPSLCTIDFPITNKFFSPSFFISFFFLVCPLSFFFFCFYFLCSVARCSCINAIFDEIKSRSCQIIFQCATFKCRLIVHFELFVSDCSHIISINLEIRVSLICTYMSTFLNALSVCIKTVTLRARWSISGTEYKGREDYYTIRAF